MAIQIKTFRNENKVNEFLRNNPGYIFIALETCVTSIEPYSIYYTLVYRE